MRARFLKDAPKGARQWEASLQHDTAMRASSLGVSALLVGGALISALTVTVSVEMHAPPAEPFSIPFVEPPAPPPPPSPQPHPQAAPEPARPYEPIAAIAPSAPALSAPEVTDLPAAAAIGAPVEIANPYWRHRPTDLDRFYPARALQRGMEGRAVLDCRVSATGALSCVVVSETPAGWGFGQAALRIAGEYAMEPAMRDGQPTVGRYRMNVPFTLR